MKKTKNNNNKKVKKARGGARTRGPEIKSLMLYQLSYTGNRREFLKFRYIRVLSIKYIQ
jgi:hypothetical protein